MKNGTIQVLLLEDSENDALLLVREFEQQNLHCECKRVSMKVELQRALKERAWDIIISDYRLPDFTGLDALKLVRDAGLDTPFISVSGALGEQQAVEVMRAGANDYLMKDNLARLVPVIRRELREAEGRQHRRQVQEELDQSRKDLEDFFEYAVIGVHFARPDGVIIRANQAELDLLGCSRDEYVGHDRAEFHADVESEQEMMRLLRAGETLRDFECQLRCRDGSVKTVLVNGNARFQNGELVHTRCFTRDVTELKRAQATISHLASLVSSSLDAIVGARLDLTVVSWNAGAEKLFGYTAVEMIGKPLSQLQHPNRPDELPSIFDRLSRGERIEGHETVGTRKGGRRVPISLTVSPILGEDSSIGGLSLIARDITTRKEEEEERLQLIKELSEALASVKTLRGLLPICAACKKIRDDRGYWQQVEVYVKHNSEADFSHAICPECVARLYPEFTPKR
jgi:PAS domain S-box-containing protein